MRPEIIINWNDPVTHASGWLIVDKLINGVCGGGIFMHAEASEKEVIELAHTMSYKNCLQHIAFGGAKAGICYDHTKADAGEVLARFIHFLEPWLRTVWCTGADLNTSNHDIQKIIDEIGLHSMFGPLGKMIAHKSGIEDQSHTIFSRMTYAMSPYFNVSEGATGYSVALAIKLMCTVNKPRVFIQGFGSVGKSLAYFLQHMNVASVVGICDVDGFIYAENGIDSMQLLNALQTGNEGVQRMEQWLSKDLKEKYNYTRRYHSDDEAYLIAALSNKHIDVLSPCAKRYSVTTRLVNSLLHSTENLHIISGANNVFDTIQTQAIAVQKGITYIPEWFSNCGNALLYQELLRISEMPLDYTTQIQQTINEKMLAFLNEAKGEKKSQTFWHDAFIQAAEQRMTFSKVNKSLHQLINS